jgi:hypothetical protein
MERAGALTGNFESLTRLQLAAGGPPPESQHPQHPTHLAQLLARDAAPGTRNVRGPRRELSAPALYPGVRAAKRRGRRPESFDPHAAGRPRNPAGSARQIGPHSFRATSGPVIRLKSGNVEAMIASDAASPQMTVAQ